MSTIQGQLVDSPTFSVGYGALPRPSVDTFHSRSNSAPGDYIRDSQTLPSGAARIATLAKHKTERTSREAKAPAAATSKALESSSPPRKAIARKPVGQGPTKAKPNLRIAIKKDRHDDEDEDRPPPPPPKSPRHCSTPSTHNTPSASPSSPHEVAVVTATLARSGSIMKAALVNTPVQTPPAKESSVMSTAHVQQTRRANGTKRDGRDKDAAKQETPKLNAATQPSNKPSHSYFDKPMPSLPMPSGRVPWFSAHIREVREAEKAENNRALRVATPPANDAQAPAPTDAASDSPATRSGQAEAKKADIDAPPPTTSIDVNRTRTPTPEPLSRPESPAKVHNYARPPMTSRDVNRSPTPEPGSRPESPANSVRTINAGMKVLPILPDERPRSATPEAKSLRSSMLHFTTPDPLQNLQDLNKQSEALHARYSTLRADRLKLSTAISQSLRAQRPGPEYANTLLDQHLALNAVSSSMDICIAKMKSLDCRKEEAMSTFLSQSRMKSRAKAWRSSAARSQQLLGPTSRSATPDLVGEQRPLSPELRNPPTFVFSPALTETHDGSPQLEPAWGRSASPDVEQRERIDANESDKRTTVIRASPHTKPHAAMSPAAAERPSSPSFAEPPVEDKQKDICVRSVKGAKVLNLLAQFSNDRPASPPPNRSLPATPPVKQTAFELRMAKKSTASPKTTDTSTPASPPAPGRKPPPPPRQGTNDSITSMSSSSRTNSPDPAEVTTPRTSEDTPIDPQGPKMGMFGSIQVIVDDDILDYYKSSGG